MIGETIPTSETPENHSEIPNIPSEPTREQNENLGERAMDFLIGHESERPETQPHEKTFEEARADDTLPDGVRDEKDYQEYQEQNKAYKKEADERVSKYEAERQRIIDENIEESRDLLKTHAYTDYKIDSLLYVTDIETTEDENGNLIYKTTEKGEPVTFIDKNRLKEGFEYLFENGISIKDLSDGGIIDMGIDSPRDIDSFVEDYYFITDNLYFPDFNNKYKPLRSLHSIIEKRKKHEPLSEEDRDFAYACYPRSINSGSNYVYYDKDNIANRLLFDGAPSAYRAEGLLEETKRAIEDAQQDGNYVYRITKVEQQRKEVKKYIERLPDNELEIAYRESESRLEEYVKRNLHDIIYAINGNDLALAQRLSNREKEEYEKEQEELGHLLLRYFKPNMGFFSPLAEKKSNLNPTKTGLGEAMMCCGISADIILDTYFGGPERDETAIYEPIYPFLEARRVKELMDIGIPKEDIIDNIRRKNEESIINGVRIDDEAIKHMRDAGIDNADILDARCDPPQYIIRANREVYHEKGFTDDDIIKYLGKLLERKEKEEKKQFDGVEEEQEYMMYSN